MICRPINIEYFSKLVNFVCVSFTIILPLLEEGNLYKRLQEMGFFLVIHFFLLFSTTKYKNSDSLKSQKALVRFMDASKDISNLARTAAIKKQQREIGTVRTVCSIAWNDYTSKIFWKLKMCCRYGTDLWAHISFISVFFHMESCG